MSWHDPQSVWSIKAGKRTRWYAVVAVCATLVSAVVLIYVGSKVSAAYFRGASLFAFDESLIFALLSSVVMTAVMLVPWRKERRTLSLIRKHDGAVCPKCRVALVQGEPRECSRCQRAFDLDMLRRFWTEYILEPFAAVGTINRVYVEGRKPPPGRWFQRFIVYARERPPVLVLYTFVIWVLISSFTAVVIGQRISDVFMQGLPIMCMCAGGVLLMTALRRREGDEGRCAKCGYLSKLRRPSSRCPECGANWEAGGGLLYGERKPRAGAIVTGCVLLLVTLIYFTGVGRQLVPTPVLAATLCGGHNLWAWDEFVSRQLPLEERLVIADDLLDCRDENGSLNFRARPWITALLASGAIPEGKCHRWYEGLMEMNLATPPVAKVGEAFEARLKVVHRLTLASNAGLEFRVIPGGFIVDDKAPIDRKNDVVHPFGLQHSEENVPKTMITPERAGTLKVEYQLWGVVAPPGTLPYVTTWNAEGTPVLPAGTIWVKRYASSVTVDVE